MKVKKCCNKGFLFKLYLLLIGIAGLIYGTISSVNCISQWNKTGFQVYTSLTINTVLIALTTLVVLVHIIGIILVLFFLSRNVLFFYLVGLTVITCLSFSAVWICFIDRSSILNNLQTIYSSFQREVDIDTFEKKFKCCGWEFISNRCTSISGVSCTSVIYDKIDKTGNTTGNTLIPLAFIGLAEVLYVIFILMCYSGIDWREIRPFIRTPNN